MSANDNQVGGFHYKSQQIQAWDYIISNNLGFLEGNIIKYISRWKNKDGIKDLLKARHYIDKLIEIENAKQDQRLRTTNDSIRSVYDQVP